ncbi:hypothetical protein H6501_02580 [Candidatus Woesearchaeota archaeon]|nr:hypothetical protein [Nanoarchaeota archaeon]MCB9370457.1 hypothetical protein [Candidatus Woesearchaeota archaeon]USN43535.1 MAG: hypothetical protein H6500_04020 [Candidatus Woesearchaeota archaeon]
MTKTFREITSEDVGKKFELQARVKTIKQTSGPTLMVLNDGTANFTLKAFLRPGARAYPEIELEDDVKVGFEVRERKDSIEGEAYSMEKLSSKDSAKFQKAIDKQQLDKVKPVSTSFSIQSEVLEKLKPRFVQVASIIREAVLEGRPILLRHNADCDGYSSAITIERAILSFMDEITGNDLLSQYQLYRRAPSKAPFYEYEDAVKDLCYWLRDKVKNGYKPPLIIITDNGSTQEDILAMQQMLLYDAKIVVVDHHYPGEVKDGKVEVDKYIEAHINPYLEGFDSNVCTGMLGFELANFIHDKHTNSVLIPAMAAILDHCDGTEKDQYIVQAEAEGYTQDYMAKLGEIVDMQSHYLRFQESREFIDDLFGKNKAAQERIVQLLAPELEKRYKQVEEVAQYYAEKEDFGPFYLIHFDGEKGTNRGEYPAVGKTTNHIHKIFEQGLDKPIVTATSGSTFLTVRVSDGISRISIPEFAGQIMREHPYTRAEGGGHERAGSVKFVEYGRTKVMEEFKAYLRKVASLQ